MQHHSKKDQGFLFAFTVFPFGCLGGNKQVTGYAFLIYLEELSVQQLVSKCYRESDRYYMLISSKTVREKPVQVRPWRLSDMDYMPRPSNFLDPRRTVSIYSDK